MVAFVFATHSVSTPGTDFPAHTYIPGRIKEGLVVNRAIGVTQYGTYAGIITTTVGDLILDNADSGLNDVISQHIVDGQACEFRLGQMLEDADGHRTMPMASEAEVIAVAVAGSWQVSRQQARLRIRDAGMRLQGQIKRRVYSGTGGSGGTKDLEGRYMPQGFGLCRNIEPQLTDPVQLIWHVNDGRVDNIGQIYDSATPLQREGPDLAGYAELEAFSVSPGRWARSHEAGAVKLGTPHTGRITADVRFGNPKPMEVIKRILVEHEGLYLSQFELEDIQPKSRIGYYLKAGEEATTEEVINNIVTGCGAVFGGTRESVFRLFEFNGPEHRDPIRTFTDREIDELRREMLPYGSPWHTWTVGTDRNWTVQSDDEVSAGVQQQRRMFLKEPFRWITANNPQIEAAHAISVESPHVETYYTDQVESQAERLLKVYRIGRRLFRATLHGALFQLDIGDVIRIVYPRYELHFGQNFVVVALTDFLQRGVTEVLCFGGILNQEAFVLKGVWTADASITADDVTRTADGA